MRDRRTKNIIYLVVIAIIAIAIAFFVVSRQTVNQGVEKIQSNKDFNALKAKSINEKEIKLVVNKKTVYPSSGKYYMSKNMNLMIPIDVVENSLNCACLKYKGGTVVVIKGNTKAILKMNSSDVKVNGSDYTIQDPLTKKSGVIYIPSSLFENYLGYAYSFDSISNVATLTDTAIGNALPTKYNYAEEGRLPKVQDQGHTNTCWAYATLSAVESTLLPNENYTFSRQHLIDYGKEIGDIKNGGYYEYSMAYLMSWNGPVTNKIDKVEKHVQSAQILTPGDSEEIKRMVFKYGGVESSIYLPADLMISKSDYYNSEKSAYCYKGKKGANHDIVIVGWDDNYSKNNFNGAKEDGAFICLNSWGKEFGKDGLFYVSYECDSFAEVSVCYTQIEDTNNYGHIYQSDLFGWNGTIGYKGKSTVYFANAFEAKRNEKIKAVGFYATEEKTKYEVFVCEDFEGVKSLNNRTHIAAKATFDNEGYYTINLDKAYKVKKGKKFSIIVKATNKKKGLKIVPVESTRKNGSKSVNLKDGEGYTSYDGEQWNNTEAEKCNVCLKAYTK